MNRLHAPFCGALIINPNPGLSVRQAWLATPLQDNTLVARAPGYPLAVEVFEERNRVFAGNACQLLETGHGDALALCFLEDGKAIAELRQGITVKNQVGRYAHQVLVP